MGRWRLVGLVAPFALLWCGCGTLLGFEDPTDLVPDAGPDAPADVVADGGSPPEGGDGASGYADGGAPDAPSTVSPSDVPGVVCVPPIPTGWQGPLALHETTGAADKQACPSGYDAPPIDGFASPTAGDATCGCTCGQPAGASCTAPRIDFFSDPGCNNACAPRDQVVSTSCSAWDLTGCTGTHFKVIGSKVAGGSCAPSGTKTNPPISWGAEARLCGRTSAPPAATCPAGAIATPTPSPPFLGLYCVARSGSMSCPAGYPVARAAYYSSFTDGRGCTACTCGSPTGVCTGTLTLGDNSSCNGNAVSMALSAAASCQNTPKTYGLYATSPPGDGGACMPAASAPTGSVTTADPLTVCCAH